MARRPQPRHQLGLACGVQTVEDRHCLVLRQEPERDRAITCRHAVEVVDDIPGVRLREEALRGGEVVGRERLGERLLVEGRGGHRRPPGGRVWHARKSRASTAQVGKPRSGSVMVMN